MYILLYSMVNRYCFVSCIQYILPLNLLNFLFTNVFLHTAEFLQTGEWEDFMPAKTEQVCQSRRENDHVTEIASLMEGEWSCHGGDQFNGGRMVMLQKWSL